jgi:hypothetical protein
MLKSLMTLLFVALATPALADDNLSVWSFGGDNYIAGRTVAAASETAGDLFIAGYNVKARADVAGSAHMAGRYVTLDGDVGQNLYAAGADVDVSGAVGGNATISGETLSITAPVTGNLRAIGAKVELSAPVAGNAVLGGQEVEIDAAIAGDLALAAETVEWGEAASVGGTLHVYTDDPDAVDVPTRVAPADRVEVHEMDQFKGAEGMQRPGLIARLQGWIGGVLVVGLLGTLFAAVAPTYVAELRQKALERPLRSIWFGFLGLSTLVGSMLFLAMTGIGIVLVPVSLIAAILLGVAGYVVGAYVLGVWATGVAGRGEPTTTGDRAIAAFSGAAIAGAVALVPWLGWLVMMAIFFIGAGALVVRMFGLGFRVEQA